MDNNAMMITKVKNIYIMLLHAISKEDISIVDHYLDDTLTKQFKDKIEENISNNIKQVYRQLNITDLNIIQDNNEYITFTGKARYITYFVNRLTNKYVSGDKTTRITKSIMLKFRKNNIKHQSLFACPNCGAGLKINTSSICPYCDCPVDERFSPYVLCSIS